MNNNKYTYFDLSTINYLFNEPNTKKFHKRIKSELQSDYIIIESYTKFFQILDISFEIPKEFIHCNFANKTIDEFLKELFEKTKNCFEQKLRTDELKESIKNKRNELIIFLFGNILKTFDQNFEKFVKEASIFLAWNKFCAINIKNIQTNELFKIQFNLWLSYYENNILLPLPQIIINSNMCNIIDPELITYRIFGYENNRVYSFTYNYDEEEKIFDVITELKNKINSATKILNKSLKIIEGDIYFLDNKGIKATKKILPSSLMEINNQNKNLYLKKINKIKKPTKKLMHLFCFFENSFQYKKNKIYLIGLDSILDGLEYHFKKFLSLEKKAINGKPYGNASHEATAYLNRLGQIYILFKSKWFSEKIPDEIISKTIPTILALIPIRNKYTAHRQQDDPKKDDCESLGFNELGLQPCIFGISEEPLDSKFSPNKKYTEKEIINIIRNYSKKKSYLIYHFPTNQRDKLLEKISPINNTEYIGEKNNVITFIPTIHHKMVMKEIFNLLIIFFES